MFKTIEHTSQNWKLSCRFICILSHLAFIYYDFDREYGLCLQPYAKKKRRLFFFSSASIHLKKNYDYVKKLTALLKTLEKYNNIYVG